MFAFVLETVYRLDGFFNAMQVPEDSIEAITDLPRLDSISSADTDDVKACPLLSANRQTSDFRDADAEMQNQRKSQQADGTGVCLMLAAHVMRVP